MQKTFLNKALFFGGLFLIVIALITIRNAFVKYKIYKSKEVVIVTLLKLPNCENGSYGNKFLTLQYENSKFILRTKCKYVSNFKVGQKIEMYHKEGTKDFIFRNENVLTELIADFLIGFIGLIIIVIAIKNQRISKSA